MTSRAHQLYRQITEADDPAQRLKDMIASQRTETEYLEFKGGRVQREQTKVKEFWSKALSGFANTEGGVFVWGIRATRIEHPDDSSRKIDAATGLDLVPTPATFVQLLKDVLLEACVEPVIGVEISEYDAGQGDGSGFVVCLIPEGRHKPYRAELDSKRQYWQRAGDNFVVIPHSLLRSLFYPRIAPRLSIFVDAQSSVDRKIATVEFQAEISNTGKATGKDICVFVETPEKVKFAPHGYQVKDLGSHMSEDGSAGTFSLKSNLHPGQSSKLFVCKLSGEPEREYGDSSGSARMFAFVLPQKKVHFQIRVCSLDQEEEDLEVTFNENELRDGCTKEAVPIG